MTYAEVLRDIWANTPALQSAIPVATDSTNRFFEDGIGFMDESDLPPEYVIIDDFNDSSDERGSQEFEQRTFNYLIRIFTKSKDLTRTLRNAYVGSSSEDGQLKDNLPGSVTDLGCAACYRIVTQRFQRASGGLHLWRGQLAITSTHRITA